MKACVLYANEDIRYEEVPTPAVRDGYVLVKVKAAGICGSDIPRVLRGGAHYYPIILGHEFSGEIVEVGGGAAGLKVGGRVAGAPLIPCKKCPDCAAGNYSLCKNYTFIGSRLPGAFAEYVLMPAGNAVAFSDDVARGHKPSRFPTTLPTRRRRFSSRPRSRCTGCIAAVSSGGKTSR